MIGGQEWTVSAGDLFVVPSWVPLILSADTELDLFRFSGTPIFERRHAARVQVDLR